MGYLSCRLFKISGISQQSTSKLGSCRRGASTEACQVAWDTRLKLRGDNYVPLAGRVFKKPCFKRVQCFGAAVLRIAERLPKAISLDQVKALEYQRNRIEFSLTRETAKQNDREIELRPRQSMRPIQDHGVWRKLRQNISLDVLLPVWTV